MMLTNYLNGVSEVVDLVACFQAVVVDGSLFLIHVLFSAQQLRLQTRELLLHCFELTYGRSFAELQLNNVPM